MNFQQQKKELSEEEFSRKYGSTLGMVYNQVAADFRAEDAYRVINKEKFIEAVVSEFVLVALEVQKRARAEVNK